MEKIIIALGGNALQEKGKPATAELQLEVAKRTSEYIAEIIDRGHEVAIAHGNGPQIGNLILAFEAAHVPMPFDACCAMSQGYIGYHLQQALSETLKMRDIHTPVVSLVTQIVVDKDDTAFHNPTKPIGAFYTEEEAKELAVEKGYTMKEDSGRGWRRVVASPLPEKIVELDTIKHLWNKAIMITVGGGGIPVIEKGDGMYAGTAAVIDKDLAAEKLADDLNADILLILTEVDYVAINFNKPNQKNLTSLTIEEAERYILEDQFAAGSMLPKVMAAMQFVQGKKGRKAIITSLYKAVDALDGKAGTIITR